MTTLPPHALSVRQPWATAIIHLGKNIENRGWRRPNPGLKFRGPVCIHAAKGMTKAEYEDAAAFIRRAGGDCPLPDKLPRGGIIGVANVVDVVTSSDSPWFMGRIGLVLADIRPVPFVPVGGQLGFFLWSPTAGGPDTAAKWMTRYGDPAELAREQIDETGGRIVERTNTILIVADGSRVIHKFTLLLGRVVEISGDGLGATVQWDGGPVSNQYAIDVADLRVSP